MKYEIEAITKKELDDALQANNTILLTQIGENFPKIFQNRTASLPFALFLQMTQ